MSDTPDLTPERIWPYPWHMYPCKHPGTAQTEYIRADLHEAERARADKAEAERDAAIAAMSEAARLRGEAEGKLLAAETPGVLEGWRRRAEAAEAERDALAEKLAKAMNVLGQTRLVLAEHEPHPLPTLARVLATIAEITGGGND